ncbi:MAG: beta-glucosidase [Xanthobacteraceae bacterium]|nr:beta-glucosidase [Xanthobacteraceae bacterium]
MPDRLADGPKPSPRSQAASEPKFVWGVSTASYQIEGAVNEDGRGPSIWDTFCRQQGRIANGDTGDIACDHYHRYPEHIALMRELGLGVYRFSIAWPRVLPAGRGVVNQPGLAFYDRLIDALLAADIEPWLCLYHWDLPQALDDRGGWTNRDCAGWFADYATLVARHYGDRIKRFATFNEPSVFTMLGYGFGWHAPGLADRSALLRAIHHVNLAHGNGVDVLRAHVAGASIGAIHNYQPCHPATPADDAAREQLDAFWNGAMPDPQLRGHYPPALAAEIDALQQPGDLARICRPVDWFGFNHYSPIYAKTDPGSPLGFRWADPPPDKKRTGMGWAIDPQTFGDTLLALHARYRLPIYVMENGFGARGESEVNGQVKDQNRIDYLQSYTDALRSAIKQGADVRGYFVWSLIDNFEWNSGYAARFGLVYVDYPTLRLTPKASFAWYANVINTAPIG